MSDPREDQPRAGVPRPTGSFTARGLAEDRPHEIDANSTQETNAPQDADPPQGAEAHTPAQPEPDSTHSRLRTWGPRVAAAALVVATLTSAVVSYMHGNQWRERAKQAAAFAEQETARADQAEELLAGSEEDVRDLEGRLAAVASDKEAATDQAQSVSIERDQFLALSAIAVQAADSLDTCVRSLYAGLNEAVRMWNTAVSSGYFGDAGYLNTYLGRVDSNCSGAQQANNELRGVVDALVGS